MARSQGPPNGGDDEEDGASSRSSSDSSSSAEDDLLEILRLYNLEYIYFLSIEHMVTLAIMFIRSTESIASRRDDVKRDIQKHHDLHRKQYPVDEPPLHRQELNELVCILDYLIKLKCNVMGILRLLEANTAGIFVLRLADSDMEDDDITPDVYARIPQSMEWEICQGAAKKLFGDYRLFNGYWKHFPKNRYCVGIFSGRVLDTKSESDKQAKSTGPKDGATNLIRDNDSHIDSHGQEWPGIKQLHKKPTTTTEWCINLANGDNLASSKVQHNVRIHRLIGVLANHLGVTVFNNGMLELIGLQFPEGRTWDNTFAYRDTAGKETRKILRALRVGSLHSRFCDGDHRLGYIYLYCHALSHCQPVSHRMNCCFVHVRKIAGHWCFGLHRSLYTDGQTTHEVDTSFVDNITMEGDQVFFNGEQIQGTNLFDVLPQVDNWNFGTVDCYCAKNGGQTCSVCLYNDPEITCFCQQVNPEKCWICQEAEDVVDA